MPEFVQVGDYCLNEACRDYGKLQSQQSRKNINKFGKTRAGRQRYQCKTCESTFTETKGTIFYRRRTPADEIIETLALVAEGSRISSLERVKGHKDDTILAWLRATSPEPILRDARQAVELAEVSARATRFQGAAELDTLAAAYARAARFSAAVRMGERAVDRARRGGDEALAAEIEARVTLYRRGQPYTDSVESAGRDPREGASFRREQRLY